MHPTIPTKLGAGQCSNEGICVLGLRGFGVEGLGLRVPMAF